MEVCALMILTLEPPWLNNMTLNVHACFRSCLLISPSDLMPIRLYACVQRLATQYPLHL